MKYIQTIIQVVFIGLMLGVAGLFILPMLPIDNNIELRIVESGSMEPSIMTGALVLIVPTESHKIGDVVTFKSATADVPTTHRIVDSYVEEGNTWFVTKGDANEENDTAPVRAENVIGKVMADVPAAGFVLDFARQPIGFILLIVLPALMIIFSEIETIWREIRNRKSGLMTPESEAETDEDTPEPNSFIPATSGMLVTGRQRPVKMMDIQIPVRYQSWPTLDLSNRSYEPGMAGLTTSAGRMSKLATMGLVFVVGLALIGANFLPHTLSYPTDYETSANNLIQAGNLNFFFSDLQTNSDFARTTASASLDEIITTIELEKGSMAAKYDVEFRPNPAQDIFCSDVRLNSNAPAVHIGSLLNLNFSEIEFSGPWQLRFSINESSSYSNGEVCSGDIVFTGWSLDNDKKEGYFDEERIPVYFAAPMPESVVLPLPAPAALVIEEKTEEVEEIVEETNPVIDEEESVEEVIVEEEEEVVIKIEVAAEEEIVVKVEEAPKAPVKETKTEDNVEVVVTE